jgi:hypothetical protein
MAISLGLGIVFGLAGGLGGRLADTVTMRLSDVLAAVPAVLFALLVITFWGDGPFNLILAIGIATMTRYARLVRTQTLLVRKAPFVEAAITLGLSRAAIIVRHILANAVRPALLLAVIGVGDKIAFAATLSFLASARHRPRRNGAGCSRSGATMSRSRHGWWPGRRWPSRLPCWPSRPWAAKSFAGARGASDDRVLGHKAFGRDRESHRAVRRQRPAARQCHFPGHPPGNAWRWSVNPVRAKA